MSDLILDLNLFGEGGAEASGGEGGNADHTAETVVYGKQAESAQAESKETTDSHVADDEQRKADYQKYKAEYKEFYDADVKSAIDRRFKNVNDSRQQFDNLNDALLPLYSRFGLNVGDVDGLQEALARDTSLYADEAEAYGMDVDQYAYLKQTEYDNMRKEQELQRLRGAQEAERAYQGWLDEAEALKDKFPNLVLEKEVQNPEFLAYLKNNLSVEKAYKAVHVDELIANGVGTAAKIAEQKAISDIQNRNSRPPENGLSSRAGVVVKADPKNFKDADFKEVIARARRGERIEF